MSKIAFITALGLIAFTSCGLAEETGLAGIHEWKPEKGQRLCMATHFHDGSGKGRTRKEAEAAATKSWAEFTAWEYGAAWASHKRAASKSMDCRQEAGQGREWTCHTAARPCKAYAKRGGSQSAGR